MNFTTQTCIDDEQVERCHPDLNGTCSSDRFMEEKSVSTCSQQDLAITLNMHADTVTAPGSSFKECDENVTSTESEEGNHKSNEADSLEDNVCNNQERSNTDDKNPCASESLTGETTPDTSSEHEHAVHYLHSEHVADSDKDSSNKGSQNSSEICQPSLETGKGDSSQDQGQFQQGNEVPEKGPCSTRQEQPAADNGQHELSGPVRRRQEARQQRRDAVNPATADTRVTIPAAVAAQWREIGFQWGLDNDNDIARVLLQHYEDMRAGRPPRPPPPPRCRGCGERMRPGPCTQCGPDKHHLRFDKDEHKGGGDSRGGFGDGGFSGGRSGFCGRCRD